MSQTYDLTVKNIFSDMADDIFVYLTGFNIKKLNDQTMPYRMLRYTVEIMEKHKLSPYQIIIYIGKGKVQMDNGLSYTLGNNKLDYRYKILDVGDLTFSNIAETGYFDLYPLLPLADRKERMKAEEQYLKRCVNLIKEAPVSVNKKKDISFKAELLSGIVYSQKVIKKIFEEVEKMLRLEESSTYKMIIEKGLKEGMEKGIKEGLKKTICRGYPLSPFYCHFLSPVFTSLLV